MNNVQYHKDKKFIEQSSKILRIPHHSHRRLRHHHHSPQTKIYLTLLHLPRQDLQPENNQGNDHDGNKIQHYEMDRREWLNKYLPVSCYTLSFPSHSRPYVSLPSRRTVLSPKIIKTAFKI